MKKTSLATAAVASVLLLAAPAAFAQTASSNSNSNSSAGASAGAVAGAGAISSSRGGTASAAGGAGYSQSGSQAQGGNAASRFTSPRAPGAIGMAGLAASSGCMGSTSIGASFIGGGFGIGSTWQDDRCNAREDARLLAAFGYRGQALQILINHSPMVREVMQPQQVAQGAPVTYRRTGTVPISASAKGCTKWAGGNVGGQCVY